MPALFGVVSSMFNGGIVLKGRLQKKVIIITFRGGISKGHLSLFFGLKMIFKQF